MRKAVKITIILLLFSAAFVFDTKAQVLPDSTIKKIDGYFSYWNKITSPGFAIGIIRNDSLIFAKGYGAANLEYDIPISAETVFHMASVSKQFTGYSMVLLAKAGKLQLDDDIHKYLPWFPDLKEKITIRHLLNHTSGIRDQWQLLAIAGTRIDDVITQEHIVKILSKQQALNSKPGELYNYSNSGFTMLAEIVKSVTGQTLRQFTDSAIFKPLSMTHTHFHDDYTEVERNRAYSYYRKNLLQFGNSILSYSNAGATSLFTTINDLSKWVKNFYKPLVGTEADIKQLTENGKLNNGTKINYALGITNDTYRGWRQYSHAGGDAGYRTWLTVFPDLKMGFLVFSNLADVDIYDKTYKLVNLFVTDTSGKKQVTETKIDSSEAIIKDETKIKNYAGNYVGDDGAQFSFVLKNKKLFWERNGNSDLLYAGVKESFSVAKTPNVKFVFNERPDKIVSVSEYWPDGYRFMMKYNKDVTPTPKQLEELAGVYYSPELECKYELKVKDSTLVLTNAKYEDSKIKIVGTDHLFSDYWWMRHLKMSRDAKGVITGFEVNDGRVMHLQFDKIR